MAYKWVLFLVFTGIIIGGFLFTNTVSAQCTTTISTFPYLQDFEGDNGNWTINGSQSSWAWGTPAKPIIKVAASGNKCWVTGGLTNAFYNSAEASWIQSPCFDFTNIEFPTLSIKVWWETERNFDGANLQYTTDNGTTWKAVGSAVSGNICLDSNWYNSQSIRFLNSFGSSADGWSGSVNSGAGNCSSSNGSGGWVTAKHSLSELGGNAKVIFRFVFGAGTQCNAFDGFAVDDFTITEATPLSGDISYSCINSNSADFRFNTTSCVTIFSWNFNDPASGGNNIATIAEPSHIFSSPGTYTVTLTAGNGGTPDFTTTQTITIFSAAATITKPIDCNGGATGEATVLAVGSTGPFSYSWNTQPQQFTAFATQLSAGSYSVNVSAPNACDVVATVTLTNSPIVISSTIQQPGCLFERGTIKLAVSGGAPPYNYSWLPNVSIADSAIQLQEGNYIATIKDSRLCEIKDTFTISKLPAPLVVAIKINDVDCNGILQGKAVAVITGGTAPYTYKWNNNPLLNADTATALQEGNNSVIVTDFNGCTAFANVTIGIGGICNEVYFPNSFSPNQDGRNDFFGPTGNVIGITNYNITVYNRYGQQVFGSNNPFTKWDGTLKGKMLDSGTYIWLAKFRYLSRIQKSMQGIISIIR